MKVSFAICTHNRAESLGRALASLTDLKVPSRVSYEIIVVDNASTDRTSEVAEQFANSLPIVVHREPRLGLSHARNLALSVAKGELLVFLDDDVLVDPDLLAAYAEAASADPDASFFGGTVLPEFTGHLPRWVRGHLPEICRVFGVTPPNEKHIDTSNYPIGANFALRMSRIRGLRFEPSFGRSGRCLGTGEETAFIFSLMRTGDHGNWAPDAVVRHEVNPARLKVGYLWRLHARYGEFCRRTGYLRRYERILQLPPVLRTPAFSARFAHQLLKTVLRASTFRQWYLQMTEAAMAGGIALYDWRRHFRSVERRLDAKAQQIRLAARLLSARPAFLPGGPLLISVVRNEARRLPAFFDHYRKLGVKNFLLLDHASEDDTAEIAAREGATVIPVSGDFIHKPLWIDGALNHFGRDRWCLVVDADEHLVYPAHQRVSLDKLCSLVEREGGQAIEGKLVDLYARRPGDEGSSKPRFFDPSLGTRRRLFGAAPCLRKTPLFYHSKGVRLARGQHDISGIRVFKGLEVALLHSKLNPDFFGERTYSHADALTPCADLDPWAVQENGRYTTSIASGGAPQFLTRSSIRYRSPEQLADLGILAISRPFRTRLESELRFS